MLDNMMTPSVTYLQQELKVCLSTFQNNYVITTIQLQSLIKMMKFTLKLVQKNALNQTNSL